MWLREGRQEAAARGQVRVDTAEGQCLDPDPSPVPLFVCVRRLVLHPLGAQFPFLRLLSVKLGNTTDPPRRTPPNFVFAGNVWAGTSCFDIRTAHWDAGKIRPRPGNFHADPPSTGAPRAAIFTFSHFVHCFLTLQTILFQPMGGGPLHPTPTPNNCLGRWKKKKKKLG